MVEGHDDFDVVLGIVPDHIRDEIGHQSLRRADHRRHGRAWDGFVLAENCEVSADPAALALGNAKEAVR